MVNFALSWLFLSKRAALNATETWHYLAVDDM